MNSSKLKLYHWRLINSGLCKEWIILKRQPASAKKTQSARNRGYRKYRGNCKSKAHPRREETRETQKHRRDAKWPVGIDNDRERRASVIQDSANHTTELAEPSLLAVKDLKRSLVLESVNVNPRPQR